MQKLPLILLVTFFTCSLLIAQTVSVDPFAHTYSIVARDSVTGEMGVAAQSHAFSVGSIVMWGEAGVGVIATQAYVNRAFGPEGLQLLKEGKLPEEAVRILTEADPGRDERQLAVLDKQGRATAYTGEKCIAYAGHLAANNFSVQANLMLNDNVIPAMTAAFMKTTGPLAERMMAAMEAAQDAGGDARGMQSAAMLIVKPAATGRIWEDRYIDLRVEDNPEPLRELKRLLHIFRAYEHGEASAVAVQNGDMLTASKEIGIAKSLFPENVEIAFWHAIVLVNAGRTADALPFFKTVFQKDSNFALLIPRLRKSEVLSCDDETEKTILSLKH